jgi:hypothetical protein
VETIALNNPKSNQEKILAAAEKEWQTIDELAVATGKTRKHLINRIIPAMVTQGKLERRYPAANHPQQAYRAPASS